MSSDAGKATFLLPLLRGMANGAPDDVVVVTWGGDGVSAATAARGAAATAGDGEAVADAAAGVGVALGWLGGYWSNEIVPSYRGAGRSASPIAAAGAGGRGTCGWGTCG